MYVLLKVLKLGFQNDSRRGCYYICLLKINLIFNILFNLALKIQFRNSSELLEDYKATIRLVQVFVLQANQITNNLNLN